MPYRWTVFVNDEFYHVYNKTIDNITPFVEHIMVDYFLGLVNYYRFSDITMCYSETCKLEQDQRNNYFLRLKKNNKCLVEILSYCIMPNHYHFLVRQKKKNGVSRYIGNIINAFTKHFNNYYERYGPLFIPQFKSKYIDNEEQLIHVSRYIHLNPYKSHIIQKKQDIWTYPLSSAHIYLQGNNSLVSSQYILGSIYFKSIIQKYKLFVEKNAVNNLTRTHTSYLTKWIAQK